MEIKNNKILVLGGWGLVGMAVCRALIEENPSEVIISSLSESEAKESCKTLSKISKIKFTPAWGNILVRDSLKDKSRSEILNVESNRRQLIHDVLDDLDGEILKHSCLYQTVNKYRPGVIVDCINSATALAYQDIFLSNYKVRKEIENFRKSVHAGKENHSAKSLVDEVEKLLCTLYVPQLIRHVQIFYEAMRKGKTEMYIKIGTSGTGGMGLNIPYTHSEEKPSRVLLSKSSVAGAHTLLLFLMARTPDAPITKEIKPTAAIAWKKIQYGDIKKGGAPIQLYDCKPDSGYQLTNTLELRTTSGFEELKGKKLQSVYIDTGENGIFSLGEFMTITSSGQMEFVTPEEIARNVVYEIKGGNTGHDIVNALDNAAMGPTYRAGYLRHTAIEKMKQLEKKHHVESIAFELLGPPRLSKLLFEASLLRRTFKTMGAVRKAKAKHLSENVEQYIKQEIDFRSQVISVGIPILLSDGKTLLRGPEIKVPPLRVSHELPITRENIEHWVKDGWVDLRVANMEKWKKRFDDIFKEIESIPEWDTSSQYERDRKFWQEDNEINIGKVVGWILIHEEKGLRMKE